MARGHKSEFAQQRGRKSEHGKVLQLRNLEEMGLPAPPADFTQEEAAQWTSIVVTYPPDRFPVSTWPMLEAYCCHAVERRRIMADIRKLVENPEYSRKEYRDQLRAMTDQSKALASFGVRLGIARTSMAGRHNSDPEQLAEHDLLPWEKGK